MQIKKDEVKIILFNLTLVQKKKISFHAWMDCVCTTPHWRVLFHSTSNASRVVK